MLKKVKTSRLKPGMFVVDLNAGWLEHPFVRNKLKLSVDDIAIIRNTGITEVTIDPELGLDDQESPSLASVEVEVFRELEALGADGEAPVLGGGQPGDREHAYRVVEQAVGAVRGLMENIQIGNPPDLAVLEGVAREVALEVVSNPATAIVVYHLHKTCEYTFAHSLRVAVLAVSCAHTIGMPEEFCQRLALGGLLHDVGKMRVRKEVLHKPDRLTTEEMDHMRQHVLLGAALITEEQLPPEAMAFLLEHHERYDGNGYPCRLAGSDISLAGRIAAIADVYDAISSDRWYHKGLPPAAAIRKIHEWSKHHFDPELTAQFIRSVGIYPVGSLVRLSNRRLAVVVENSPGTPLHPRVLPVFDLHEKKLFQRTSEIDLSERRHLRIESYEDPSDWGIDPGEYL